MRIRREIIKMKEFLQKEFRTYDELEELIILIIRNMERIDDDIFERSQKLDPYSDANQKMQALATTCNSCMALFTYINDYECSNRGKFDFQKLLISIRKLVKVLLDVERVLNLDKSREQSSVILYS